MAGIEQEQELLMMKLIMMLTENAWVLLGKRTNPVTGKEEIDLAGARYFIDTLGALKDRTEGRLTSREVTLLETELTNLRLNYVEGLKTAGKDSTVGAAEQKDSEAEAVPPKE